MKIRPRKRSVVLYLLLALTTFGISCGSTPSRGTAASVPAPTPTPIRDARVVSYGSMVNGDMGALNTDFYKKFLCETRERCVGELQDMRAAAGSLLRDLTNTPAPEAISQPAANLKAATQQLSTGRMHRFSPCNSLAATTSTLPTLSTFMRSIWRPAEWSAGRRTLSEPSRAKAVPVTFAASAVLASPCSTIRVPWSGCTFARVLICSGAGSVGSGRTAFVEQRRWQRSRILSTRAHEAYGGDSGPLPSPLQL